MDKYSFFQSLKKNLTDIPTKEYHDTLEDFEEHFHIGLQKGKSEHRISEELGDPKMLAESIKSDFNVDEDEKKQSQQNVAIILGLSLLNLLFILPVLILSILCLYE